MCEELYNLMSTKPTNISSRFSSYLDLKESDGVVEHHDPHPGQLAALLGSPRRRLAADPLHAAGVELGAVARQRPQSHLAV